MADRTKDPEEPYVQDEVEDLGPLRGTLVPELPPSPRPRGRAAPGKPTFTFPDSGITVRLPRVGPDTLGAIQRAVANEHPAPKPPQVVTPLGIEENRADPEYKKALNAHLFRNAHRIGERLYMYALQLMEVDIDADLLKQNKEALEAIGVKPSDDLTDREFYIRHIAISSSQDVTALIAYLTGNAIPTAEAVREHLDAFRG